MVSPLTRARPAMCLAKLFGKQASRKIGITGQTYYRWRKEYGGLRIEQVKRLKNLEKENARLKKLVAVPRGSLFRLTFQVFSFKNHSSVEISPRNSPLLTVRMPVDAGTMKDGYPCPGFKRRVPFKIILQGSWV